MRAWLVMMVLVGVACVGPVEQGSDAGGSDAGGSDAGGSDAGGSVDAGPSEGRDAGEVDAGPRVVPEDLLALDATSSGGFGLPICRTADGGYEWTSRWHVELDGGTVSFTVCRSSTDGGVPWLERGARTLTASQLTTLDSTLAGVTASSATFCGADKSTLKFTVTTPTQTLGFKDAFYACQPEPNTTMVFGIDQLFDWLWDVSR